MKPRPRVLLVALRDAQDPMLQHEVHCFLTRGRLEDDQLDVHLISDGRPARSRLERYDAVAFGGSGAYSVLDDVPWIRDGVAALQDTLDAGRPGWASCFGFQGLALALGGEVTRDESRAEVGAVWLALTEAGRADPVVGGLPREGFWAQAGHLDHVTTLPPGVTLLATGSNVPFQAFRVDGMPFYASQFHPELTPPESIIRVRHYREHYQGDDEMGAVEARFTRGDTPEMAEVFPRLLSLV